MPTPGFVACPGSLHSRSLGAQTESGATEVGLQGRTANQGGRRRETGEGLGAPFSSFAQIRSSWPGWALAREAWMVGWRKASPKRGRQSGIVFPHSTTPPSENPSTSAASTLCLPHFSQTLLGARVGKPGEGDFRLGKSHVSLFSLRPPTSALIPVRRGARGTFRQSRPCARHPPTRVPGPPPQAGTNGARRQRHLLPQGPLAAHPPRLCGKCASAGERA